jgi:putative restriction endonuclease
MELGGRDAAIRGALFEWLRRTVAVQGDVLAWKVLKRGFEVEGQRVAALHPAGRGIWKPAGMDGALSLMTGTRSPYDDHFRGDRLAYSYQGKDPESSDNRAVRLTLEHGVPLAYFHAVEKSWYFAAWPVFVVKDEPAELRFWVQAEPAGVVVGGASIAGSMEGSMIAGEAPRRAYGTTQVQVRLHQRGFRERVLAAYKSSCAMCDLKHRELLDAAHIVPDAEGGEPVVTNGLALCKIHHAAFDQRVIGVDPDGYRIAVREDVLLEVDGPMLRHGIQGMEGRTLWVPRGADKRPSAEGLAVQWGRFLGTG